MKYNFDDIDQDFIVDYATDFWNRGETELFAVDNKSQNDLKKHWVLSVFVNKIDTVVDSNKGTRKIFRLFRLKFRKKSKSKES